MTMTDRAGEAELLAQVYAAPADDAPRQVYADWLLERGDPRGELIALQLERARGKARKGGRIREDELLDEYGHVWSAPLGARRVLGADGRPDRFVVEFARGFPAVVTIDDHMNDHPMWGTVTHCNHVPHHDGRHVQALRAITAADNADVLYLALLREPLLVEELAWGRKFEWRSDLESMSLVVPPDVRAAYDRIRVLPRLRRLEVSPGIIGPTTRPDTLAWLWRAPLAATLEELCIGGQDLVGWITALSATRLRRFELAMAVETYRWQMGSQIIVERDERRVFGNVTVFVVKSAMPAIYTLLAQFERLDYGMLSSVRIAIASKADWQRSAPRRQELERLLEAKGVTSITIEKASR